MCEVKCSSTTIKGTLDKPDYVADDRVGNHLKQTSLNKK